ncbi:MAG: hypothetical protein AAF518_18915 [Spirochaetota bacterium]
MKNKKNIFFRLFATKEVNSKSTKDRVQEALLELLPKGLAYSDVVAAKLGMDEKTIVYKLQEEGCTFAEAVEEARKTLAIHYIREDYRLEEIASLLGYTNTRTLISKVKERIL